MSKNEPQAYTVELTDDVCPGALTFDLTLSGGARFRYSRAEDGVTSHEITLTRDEVAALAGEQGYSVTPKAAKKKSAAKKEKK